MPTLTANGVDLSYRQTGQGPDLVLIHGLAANQAFWLPTALQLSDRFRITAFDLRGHGYSQMTAAGYAPLQMVEDVVGLLDQLHISRGHLVGHSFGGVVALGVALRHPDRVSSLTIADTRIRSLQPRQRLREIPEWDRLAVSIRQSGVPLDDDEPELGISLLEALATRSWRERFRRFANRDGFIPFMTSRGGDRSAERWLQLMRSTQARKELRESLGVTTENLRQIRGIPLLGCYAARSPNLQTLRELAIRIPQLRTRIVEGVGHYFPLTHPEILVEELPEFLSRSDHPPPCSALAGCLAK